MYVWQGLTVGLASHQCLLWENHINVIAEFLRNIKVNRGVFFSVLIIDLSWETP